MSWRRGLKSHRVLLVASSVEKYSCPPGTLIPGGMNPSEVPQMIVITFDDAVNDENWDLYQVCYQKTAVEMI